MPFARPSPTTSPVSTATAILPSPSHLPSSAPCSASSTPTPAITAASSPSGLPRRHHVRSYSSDAGFPVPRASLPAVESTGYIFVHAATPPQPERGTTRFNPAGGYERAPVASTSSAPASIAVRSRRKSPSFTMLKESSLSHAPSDSKASDDVENAISNLSTNTTPKRPLHQKARSEMAIRLDMDDLELEPHFKTPMLRKKSGELVRPSLKQSSADGRRTPGSFMAKSAPATPSGTKNVHFDSHLEHVKHFLAQQRPTAVSRDGSPVETETEGEEEFPFPLMAEKEGRLTVHIPNLPVAPDLEGKTKDVYLRSLDLTPDGKSLRGIVQVKNLSFHKWIAIRFTFDSWQTVSEVSAEWAESLPGGHSDRFIFYVKLHDLLARIEEKQMYLAVRFTVDGREIWDNNEGTNYHIHFRRVKTSASASTNDQAAKSAQAAARRAATEVRIGNAWNVSTPAQADERTSEIKQHLDRLVQDDIGMVAPIQFKKPSGSSGSGGGFSSRYDFGSSLKMVAKASPRGSPLETSQSKQTYAFPSTFIGGMPATGAPTAGRDDFPPLAKGPKELPAFVGPFTPQEHRPPSPPRDHDEPDADTMAAFPYAAKLAAQTQNQTHKPGTRFFSFPPTRPGIESLYASGPYHGFGSLDRLAPPDVDPSGHCRRGSLGLTPAETPVDSPNSRSPPQRNDMGFGTGLPSPSPSESGPSSPETMSPDSPATSDVRRYMLDGQRAEGGRPAMGTPSYGDFVSNFCWNGGGALGLTTASGEPLGISAYDPHGLSRVCSAAAAAAIVTPRALSPMPIPTDLLQVASNFGRSSSPFVQTSNQQAVS